MQPVQMLNIGCGGTFHSDWINLDVSSSDPNVLIVDINKGLPFSSESISVCYSSHVLEHLEKDSARNLIAECFRIMKRDGVIRLVLPDLEALMHEYLKILDDITTGNINRELDYDWIMLELYDQTVRSYPGGDMAFFLTNIMEKDRAFVRSRIGVEAEQFWVNRQVLPSRTRFNSWLNKKNCQKFIKLFRLKLAGWLVFLIAGKEAYRSFLVGIFRNSGEVHQWMYDRYSLGRLLNEAGFANVKICKADESCIPDFKNYSLDVVDGVVRKPDSLYIEASKP